MPTSATHITVVERIAATNPAMAALLGDPFADPDTPEGIKMRFAKLGAVGPDIFYALADYGRDLQDLENFLIKVAGTSDCIAELMGKVGRYVNGLESIITHGVTDSLHQTFDLVGAAMTEGLLALIVGPAGMNFWPVFKAARQKDLPREKWFWADYLHYIKSGTFARTLIADARATGDPNLLAYAYGYLTHYVTDTIGHPYVNQVVQSPFRTYWQRHHVVENYVDAYVWDRWHTSNPAPAPPSPLEQPLDTLTAAPNATGMGAPVTFARLNDHINIGGLTLGDPVDQLVEAVCQKIEQGLFDIGIAEIIQPDTPGTAEFKAWCDLVASTMATVYDTTVEHRTPDNLANFAFVPGSPLHPDGHPNATDVGAAYGVFRLVLRMGTEEKIAEPMPPDILGDITAAVNKLAADLQKNLGSFPPPPTINGGGSFSWEALWDAVKRIAAWAGEVLAAVGKTAFDLVADLIAASGTVVSDSIKYSLYVVNKALFAVYSALRDVLVYAGYAIPFTNRLSVEMGGGHNSEMLWRSAGNSVGFPVEEIPEENSRFFSKYAPFVPPAEQLASQNPQGGVFVEHPTLNLTAPYTPAPGLLLTPDVFLDGVLGPDDMFMNSGLQVIPPVGAAAVVTPRDFGGAIANCVRGITLAETGFPNATSLPDYNLDGDRSYAWPCWDIRVREPKWPTPQQPSGAPLTTTPLRPAAQVNDTTVTEATADVLIAAN